MPAGIADGFREYSLGVLVDQPLDRVRLVAVREPGVDALARQDVREQRVGRAVELRNGDNVAAGVGKVDKGIMQRRLSGRNRERADAALEIGHALFEYCRGWIGDPAVAISFGFEIEQSCAVIGAIEGIGDRLVDRNRNRFGYRIGVVAGVNGDGFVAHCPPLRWRHAFHMRCSRPLLFCNGEGVTQQQFANRLTK